MKPKVKKSKLKFTILKSDTTAKELLNAQDLGFQYCLQEEVRNLSELVKFVTENDVDALECISTYLDKLKDELHKSKTEIQ